MDRAKRLLPGGRCASSCHHQLILYFTFSGRKKWAARQGDWKLIAQQGKKPEKGETGDPAVRMTLHNLADGEPEAKDYAKERPEIVERLQALHEEWLKEVTSQ